MREILIRPPSTSGRSLRQLQTSLNGLPVAHVVPHRCSLKNANVFLEVYVPRLAGPLLVQKVAGLSEEMVPGCRVSYS